jgi:hypothetical protein
MLRPSCKRFFTKVSQACEAFTLGRPRSVTDLQAIGQVLADLFAPFVPSGVVEIPLAFGFSKDEISEEK